MAGPFQMVFGACQGENGELARARRGNMLTSMLTSMWRQNERKSA